MLPPTPRTASWPRYLLAPEWRYVRRFAVPEPMIEQATSRRLAGDWRGACAAADIELHRSLAVADGSTLDTLTRVHGTETAARVEDDLRHLAPELLRWHLPRAPYQSWTWDELGRAPLARYPDARLALTLSRAPEQPGRPPLTLGLTPIRRRWSVPDVPRWCWDVRQVAGLGDACGPRPVTDQLTALHEAGRITEALDLLGVDQSEFQAHTSGRAWATGLLDTFAALPLVWSRLLPAARRLLAADRTGRTEVRLPGGLTLDLAGVRPRLLRSESPPWTNRGRPPPPVLPLSEWVRPLDADLLRHGVVRPDDLHPLVRPVLLPDEPPTPPGPPRPVAVPPARVPVRCRERTHWLALRDGQPRALDHTEDDLRRERLLSTFGGQPSHCAAALDAWRTGTGRLPVGLVDLRDEFWQRVAHGDSDGLVDLLDHGWPPVPSSTGQTLLHQLSWLDHRRLLPRLLAAGLPVDAPDRRVETPLGACLRHCGPADLMVALLAAGADRRLAERSVTARSRGREVIR